MKIITTDSIVFSNAAGTDIETVNSDHLNFNRIKAALIDDELELAFSLLSSRASVVKFTEDTELTLVGNDLLYKGKIVPGILGERILMLAQKGLPVELLTKFLDNLRDNPSHRAQGELYGFLEVSQLPITEDGCFLAYKSVRQDFTDSYTGTFDNSVGQVVKMPRNEVDEDKDQTCSNGLHFAAHEYASSFHTQGHLMVIKVNPKDVVAIPSDYHNQKGRCCKYEVVEEVEYNNQDLVGAQVHVLNVLNLGPVIATIPDFVAPYVPQENNFDDEDLWDFEGEFIGKSEVFPIDRDVEYTLTRDHGLEAYVDLYKEYGRFFFTNYDEKNDNLVFKQFQGEDFKFVTVSDLDTWEIHIAEDQPTRKDLN